MWWSMSGESMTTTFEITASTAEICCPTPQIQKLVRFKLSTHALYGVASISRLLKIIGLFCKRAL